LEDDSKQEVPNYLRKHASNSGLNSKLLNEKTRAGSGKNEKVNVFHPQVGYHLRKES